MGACAAVSWRCEFPGSIIEVLNTNFSIVGGAAQLIRALTGGIVSVVTSTITVTGTPAFTTFAQAEGGVISFYSPTTTFSGSATGARYSATLNAVINTFGGGANYFPGNAGGATGTGGQHLLNLPPYNPAKHYWFVGGDETRPWSKRGRRLRDGLSGGSRHAHQK